MLSEPSLSEQKADFAELARLAAKHHLVIYAPGQSVSWAQLVDERLINELRDVWSDILAAEWDFDARAGMDGHEHRRNRLLDAKSRMWEALGYVRKGTDLDVGWWSLEEQLEDNPAAVPA